MLFEVSNTTWLEKEYVISDYKYNLTRERICYKRFEIHLY